MNTWKIGSRWGTNGPSVLYMFLNYGCLFFDKNDWEINNIHVAKRGDLVLVCDGATPVAVAEMLSPFTVHHENNQGIKLCNYDLDVVTGGGETLVICKAHLILFEDDNEKNWEDWHPDIQKRFCSYNHNPQKLKDAWDILSKREANGQFSIKSSVHTLASTGKAPLLSDNIFYRIPVYQRPYSWGEDELRRVFEDLKIAYSQNDSEPVFMGTTQFSNGIKLSLNNQSPQVFFDVIDGQQRLTSFMLLTCMLEQISGGESTPHKEKNLITHVNRGSAQKDLEDFWSYLRQAQYHDWKQYKQYWNKGTESINPYLRNASLICNLLEEYFLSSDEDDESQEAIDVVNTAKQLYAYMKDSLLFVVIETRAGLSKTLKIFNSINTAGLDLGVHDLFKLRLYEHRKNVGDGESVFERISGIYEQVDEHNRQMGNKWWGYTHMWTVLEIYQRFLVVKHDMPRELYDVSMTRFFDRLFETILGTRKWEEFADYQNIQLDLADLERIVESLKTWSWEYITNEKLRIIHRFITQDSRYGNVWNYTVLALCRDAIKKEEIEDFHESLFKLLVPPSLCYAKRVYEMNSALLDALRSINSSKSGVQELHTLIKSGGLKGKADEQFNKACGNELTAKTKWKNLVCRLVEYLQSGGKQTEEMLFNTSIDIEHIQCYTDKEDPIEIWETWKDELNKMGNLVILESNLNRSIGNDHCKKKEAYSQSSFCSVKALVEQVENWKLSDAETRRKELQKELWKYLSNNS